MNRNSFSSPPSNDGEQLSVCPEANELDGLVQMGMKPDALGLARRIFKQQSVNADAFIAAFNAVLTQADRTQPWTKLVDAAYARLPKRGQRAANFLMLSFHCGNGNHEVAQRFLPKRFDGEFGLLELAFAMETMLVLDRMKEAEMLARKFPHAIAAAENPAMKAMLMCQLADYFARTGNGTQAIPLWEEVRLDSCLAESANLGIVHAHLAAAMQAVKTGLASVAKLKSNPDPTLAITLPGNERERWAKLETQLNRLGTKLEKLVTKERWREFNLDL